MHIIAEIRVLNLASFNKFKRPKIIKLKHILSFWLHGFDLKSSSLNRRSKFLTFFLPRHSHWLNAFIEMISRGFLLATNKLIGLFSLNFLILLSFKIEPSLHLFFFFWVKLSLHWLLDFFFFFLLLFQFLKSFHLLFSFRLIELLLGLLAFRSWRKLKCLFRFVLEIESFLNWWWGWWWLLLWK